MNTINWAADAVINTGGMLDWIRKNPLPLIVVFVGMIIAVGAKRGKLGEVMIMVVILVIGAGVIYNPDSIGKMGSGLMGLISGG